MLSPGLLGATVGLVGLGRIGREVVKRLAGFGCAIVATDPAADSGEWRKKASRSFPSMPCWRGATSSRCISR